MDHHLFTLCLSAFLAWRGGRRSCESGPAYLHDDLASLGFAGSRLAADHDGLRPLTVLCRRRGHVAVCLIRDRVHVRRFGLDKAGVVGPTLAIHLIAFSKQPKDSKHRTWNGGHRRAVGRVFFTRYREVGHWAVVAPNIYQYFLYMLAKGGKNDLGIKAIERRNSKLVLAALPRAGWYHRGGHGG